MDTTSIRTDRPEVASDDHHPHACIHCYGSGWILDPTEDDEDRTLPCHMCEIGDEGL